MRNIGFLSLALSAALLPLGCEKNTPSAKPPDPKIANAKEKSRDGAEATETAKVKRDEYVREMSKQLDELNVKYEELKGRATKAGDQANKDLGKKLEEAKVKRDVAAKKLDEVKEAGADRWDKVKEGVGSAFDDLKKAFD